MLTTKKLLIAVFVLSALFSLSACDEASHVKALAEAEKKELQHKYNHRKLPNKSVPTAIWNEDGFIESLHISSKYDGTLEYVFVFAYTAQICQHVVGDSHWTCIDYVNATPSRQHFFDEEKAKVVEIFGEQAIAPAYNSVQNNPKQTITPEDKSKNIPHT
tara:strand:+ start:159672 stop:160151 length:480 start_codon:yes stop_codon:yes gene_type:complete